MKATEIQATITPQKLGELIDIFTSLGKIHETIRIKNENNSLLIYSLIGPDNAVHAFKFYELNFLDYFSSNKDFNGLDFVLSNIKNITKQLNFFTGYDKIITFNFSVVNGSDLGAGEKLVKSCYITNDIFESFIIGDEPFIIRNLTLENIKNRVNPELKKFGFKLKLDDFVKIKKLINLNSTNDAIDFTIENNEVKAKEKGWSLKIAKTDAEDQTITFHKKYIKNAEELDEIEVDAYDTFVVFRGSNSILMLTLELKEYNSY